MIHQGVAGFTPPISNAVLYNRSPRSWKVTDINPSRSSEVVLSQSAIRAISEGRFSLLQTQDYQKRLIQRSLTVPQSSLHTGLALPNSKLTHQHVALLHCQRDIALLLDNMYPELKFHRSNLYCERGERNPRFTGSALELACAMVLQAHGQDPSIPGLGEWVSDYAAAVNSPWPSIVSGQDSRKAEWSDNLLLILKTWLFQESDSSQCFCRLSCRQARETAFLPQAVLYVLFPKLFPECADKRSFEDCYQIAHKNMDLHSALMSYCSLLDKQKGQLQNPDTELLIMLEYEGEDLNKLRLAVHRQHAQADAVWVNTTEQSRFLSRSGKLLKDGCQVIILGHGTHCCIGHFSPHPLCRFVIEKIRALRPKRAPLPNNMSFILNSCFNARPSPAGSSMFSVFAKRLCESGVVNADIRATTGQVWSGFGEDGSGLGACIIAEGSNEIGWDVEVWQGPSCFVQQVKNQTMIRGVSSFNRVYDLVQTISIIDGKVHHQRSLFDSCDDSEGLYSLRTV